MIGNRMRILFLFFFASLCGQQDTTPIVVNLATAHKLISVDLVPLSDPSLNEILTYDLAHNGMNTIVPHTLERQELTKKWQEGNSQALTHLRNGGVEYLIIPTLSENKLSAQVIHLPTRKVQQIAPIDASKNRQSVHQLADAIHKALFGAPGIATTHFLYTVRNYNAQTNKWISEVWEADWDGHNARQITHTDNYCVTPSYIPPKKGHAAGSFFFVSYAIGQPKIIIASLSDGQGQRFSYIHGNQLLPTMSHQRDQVAFICDVTGNPDLFLQGFDPAKGPVGKPRQIFSSHQATQGTPTFSPDGKRIAFVSNKDGNPRIYVIPIPPPGTPLKNIKAELITKRNRESTAPCWSPDGKKLAYCSKSDGIRQIWIYDFEKGEELQLTHGPGTKENPTWAANSLHLLYNTTDPGACEIYQLNLNQPNVIQLSRGPGEKHFPAAEPR
ncbi:MAG: Tol-Pal system protein TolB [Chlamydiia bacterium]|nr:Tol-Pal system protein TolB [Chlamydiia bacterium]